MVPKVWFWRMLFEQRWIPSGTCVCLQSSQSYCSLWLGSYSLLWAVVRINVSWIVRGEEWEITLSPFVLLLLEVKGRQIVVLNKRLHDHKSMDTKWGHDEMWTIQQGVFYGSCWCLTNPKWFRPWDNSWKNCKHSNAQNHSTRFEVCPSLLIN